MPPPNTIALLRSTHSALLVRPAAKNQKPRFYSLQLAPGLFGDWAVAKEWGAIGNHKTTWSVEWHRTEEQARRAFGKRLQDSYRRGFDFIESRGNV